MVGAGWLVLAVAAAGWRGGWCWVAGAGSMASGWCWMAGAGAGWLAGAGSLVLALLKAAFGKCVGKMRWAGALEGALGRCVGKMLGKCVRRTGVRGVYVGRAR